MTTGTRFVGRDSELAYLGSTVARSRQGVPTSVVIEADAGLGKSRLLAEVLTAFRDPKDLVAVGHGIELAGGELPYGTVTDTLRTLVGDAGAEAVRAAAGAYVDELAVLCPSLGAAPAAAGVDRVRLLPAYVTTLERLGEDRLVWLVIEDLHWVDELSRDLLTYLVRVVRSCQLALLLTVRTHDPSTDPAATDLVTQLTSLDAVSRVTLSPLRATDSADLVADLTGGAASTATIERVVSLAQGSPLLTEQLIAAGLDPSAESVTGPMTTRIRALDPATRRLVQVASLAEEHLTHRLLAQAYGEADFADVISVALDTNLLKYDRMESMYKFNHALLRQAAEDSLNPLEGMDIHRSWAELLTEASHQGGCRVP